LILADQFRVDHVGYDPACRSVLEQCRLQRDFIVNTTPPAQIC